MKVILPEDKSYNEYIQTILDQRANIKDDDNYQEKHHIIPKCLGGSDCEDNLIFLYPQEHYYAHKLLAQQYPNHQGLRLAWYVLSHKKNSESELLNEIDAEEYAELKNSMIDFYKNINSGRKKTLATRQKISENHADVSKEKNPMWGKHHTLETREKLRQVNLGKSMSEDVKIKMSKALSGIPKTQETIQNMKKSSWKNRGLKNPSCKKVVCLETGEIFDSVAEAGIWAGFTKSKNPGASISAYILHPDKHKYAGHHPITKEPLTWQYYTE